MTERDIAYVVTHTFKHNLCNQFDQVVSTPIVEDSLAGLWALRGRLHYYSYGDKFENVLGSLINFNVPDSEINAEDKYSYSFSKSKRESFRRLAEPALVIPDVTDTFSEGILTDVARETKRIVLEHGKLFEDEERARSYLQRKELNIDVQRLREIYADSHAYTTFLIGYCFPKLGTIGDAVAKTLGLEDRLENPLLYIERLIGSDVLAK